MFSLETFFFFLDHFDHIKHVIGTESIGIGADFDGAQGQVNFLSMFMLQKSHALNAHLANVPLRSPCLQYSAENLI